MSTATISIYGQRQVYATDRVEKALGRLDREAQPHLARQLSRMIAAGGTRYVAKPYSTSSLDELYAQSPNFSGVLDDLRKYMMLAIEGNEPLSFVPILLLGDPGVGKTHFGKMLGKALGTEFQFLSMASTTAGFILGGSSSSWKDSKPGMVAKSLIEGELANPVMLLDEIDKSTGSAYQDPLGPLYALLESETAASFTDEYLEVPIDATGITWVFTANDASTIPSAILDRMEVYEVPAPTFEQARTIAASIYGNLLRAHNWKFPPALSDDSLDAAARFKPREMRKRLLDAMGTAKMAGRSVVQPDDFGTSAVARKHSIGFLTN
jgi:ATP-dependent Lon protease